ncbi:cell filamentation protein Fic [candidate division WOR-1 bacterium RIFOXYB2_FULL_42_35]|uniref:Cell filamentation protein Fic n=1 Tax=candidate division WOR-1 bacterium RIFOXYC2_FULL_41_25 TaxID=1802586 RepID=A0A1F4TQE2_UNCSA|nr:MAG: cell filamentation protein Fic [candidate division WOR-1 bacterium RIFOXYA2_FULL_41_14]OGC25503.1 MAG: cell filamentation protein Fic [candidate division WOR-1 bacterium RIFOXYB2_FULL_42_35]OGC34935.1 MAG: cell filamentation protein Fic [candidate division WOR-1 bacterium RIFOXYC2_FULL_41_25]OGC42007.1 MAG: cell filamentation protein Fic [candidate division WOR-1 bacterium RIFOXYD2_FULL_41_8]
MVLDSKLSKRIKEKKKKLDSLRPFPKAALAKIKEQIAIEWTYNSNAIEGSTLSLSETRLVVEEGITIKGKTLREHFEAINHKEAIDFIEDVIKKKVAVSTHLIRQLHQLILTKIDDEEAGNYRKLEVRITGSKYIPPSPILLSSLMHDFDLWLKKNIKKLPVIELAALAHFKLVHIHPFIDGNGRTARLLMNLILMRAGYPPAVILKVDRNKYFRTLKQAHEDNYKPFIDFVARAVERSLDIYLNNLTPILSKKKALEEKYVPLSEATKYCSYSQEYLSLLSRRGKLEAIKFDRNWYTTKKAIAKYLQAVKETK